jgi:DNA-binding MarR family transcriptional regulator
MLMNIPVAVPEGRAHRVIKMSDNYSDEVSDKSGSALESGLDTIADDLRLSITRTARALRQEAGGDLTPTALSALASIGRYEPVTPARLAEAESVKRPTATRIIAHLTDSGMVERTVDPGDRRSFALSLTDAGRLYLEERRSRKSAYLSSILRGLPPEDVEILARAAQILDRTRPGAPGGTAAEGETRT